MRGALWAALGPATEPSEYGRNGLDSLPFQFSCKTSPVAHRSLEPHRKRDSGTHSLWSAKSIQNKATTVSAVIKNVFPRSSLNHPAPSQALYALSALSSTGKFSLFNISISGSQPRWLFSKGVVGVVTMGGSAAGT